MSSAASRPRVFPDRYAAGVELGQELARRAPEPPLLVLGLPRGGVPVAAAVAHALAAPLDVLLVRKLGAPWQPEFALGAIASGGILVRNSAAADTCTESQLQQILEKERLELERRETLYRGSAPPLQLHDRSVVLVDDGWATGTTALAAARAARAAGARRVIAAAPVASPEAVARLRSVADEVIVLEAPFNLQSVGEWYADFHQLSDTEVRSLLAAAQRPESAHR